MSREHRDGPSGSGRESGKLSLEGNMEVSPQLEDREGLGEETSIIPVSRGRTNS